MKSYLQMKSNCTEPKVVKQIKLSLAHPSKLNQVIKTLHLTFFYFILSFNLLYLPIIWDYPSPSHYLQKTSFFFHYNFISALNVPLWYDICLYTLTLLLLDLYFYLLHLYVLSYASYLCHCLHCFFRPFCFHMQLFCIYVYLMYK